MTPQRFKEIKHRLTRGDYSDERRCAFDEEIEELIKEAELLQEGFRIMGEIVKVKIPDIELMATLGSMGDTLETDQCVDHLQNYFNSI